MKKIVAILLAVIVCFSFAGCSGVPQEEYNRVLQENEELKNAQLTEASNMAEQLHALSVELQELKDENSRLSAELESANATIQELTAQNSDLSSQLTLKESELADLSAQKTASSSEKEAVSENSSSASGQSNDTTVYITDTGAKYHRGSCSSLKKSKHAISLSEAKSSGYGACKKCNPPS
ncbi:hypothetical protein CE91St36_06530 [Christensenellaceae bacterium]|nr:hypothetical protein CE91St36_06530 [Christensenellaceae bacterium]BDF60504.1 hypothetical protein CE91St37_06540 [Christensenellaceae bacterium]